MIEVPRAALCAAELAADADFLAIGSNDLSQFTLAVSRDDAQAGFLRQYVSDGVIGDDPLERFDLEGVGRLLRICVEEARGRRPELPIGLCGEHAGQADSLPDLASLGLDYVSCSPRRVPVARFALGRAALACSSPVSA